MITLLEELQSDWDIIDIQFDFKNHALIFQLAPDPNNAWRWKEKSRAIRCEGVIAIRYGARLNDSQPWLFDKATVEEISNEITSEELAIVGLKHNPYVKVSDLSQWGPYFRFNVYGECRVTVICRKVIADDAPNQTT